jgi:DNA-directed RNA polymerase specialized sigma24 family protein
VDAHALTGERSPRRGPAMSRRRKEPVKGSRTSAPNGGTSVPGRGASAPAGGTATPAGGTGTPAGSTGGRVSGPGVRAGGTGAGTGSGTGGRTRTPGSREPGPGADRPSGGKPGAATAPVLPRRTPSRNRAASATRGEAAQARTRDRTRDRTQGRANRPTSGPTSGPTSRQAPTPGAACGPDHRQAAQAAPTPAEPGATTQPGQPATEHRHRGPEAAFDALHLRCARELTRQVDVLTGDHRFARQCVAHAFDLAWQHWPEVARDCDPVGWVRAAAHQFALAPWQRWLPDWAPGERLRFLVPDDPFAAAMLRLPPPQRLAVLLHDGLGLSAAMVAAEAEASTAATAARIVRGRDALVADVPDLAAPEDVPERLVALLAAEPAPEPSPQVATARGLRGRGRRPGTPGTDTDTAAASGSGACGNGTSGDGATGTTGTPAGNGGPAGGGTVTGGGTALGGGTRRESRLVAGAMDSPESLRLASERGVRHRTAAAYALTGAIALATLTAVLLGPDTGQPRTPDSAVPGRSTAPATATATAQEETATARSGDGPPGPAGPAGTGARPSGVPGWMP